jgi:hypothetical protein
VATLQPPKDLFSLLILGIMASHERDVSCVMVWGCGGEREGVEARCKGGGKSSPPPPVKPIQGKKMVHITIKTTSFCSFLFYLPITKRHRFP